MPFVLEVLPRLRLDTSSACPSSSLMKHSPTLPSTLYSMYTERKEKIMEEERLLQEEEEERNKREAQKKERKGQNSFKLFLLP